MAKKKDDEAAEDGEAKGGMSKIKLIAIILPVLLIVGGGVYFFVLAPKSDSSTKATASASATADSGGDGSGDSGGDGSGDGSTDSSEEDTPVASSTYVAGATVAVDPVTINLAGGHFLTVGLLLQATADAGEEVPPGKAADCLITEFSGKTVDEIATKEGRDAAKKELLKAIKKAYEKKVYLIYYTSFVMN
jgi:flagellar FliL protein